MANEGKEFIKQIGAYIQKTETKTKDVVNGTIAEFFSKIVERTPVDKEEPSHQGTAKGNWQIGKDSPPSEELVFRDAWGGPTIRRETAKLDESIPKVFWIVNNKGYVNMLEYGLYKPPNSRRLTGGFSTQAPNGMVRITAEEFHLIVKDQAMEYDK